MNSQEQLEKWLAGDSVHRGNRVDQDSECCPDFSCCVPGLLAPLEERQRFVRGDRSLLGVFLGRAIARKCQGKDVYIAGRDAKDGGA